jgi:2-dehydropantoate 2-reductase
VAPVGGVPRPGSSQWQSLHRRTGTIEADYLNGEIVMLGRLHDVPTPVNALLRRLAHELVAGGRPPGAMSTDELRALVERSSAGCPPI